MAELNVGGEWIAHQDNGFDVHFNLRQNGNQVRGSATVTPGNNSSERVTGEVSGNDFHVVVFWHGGSSGDYSGELGADKRLRGLTFDVNNPKSQANWFSEREF
jgi:hypothetical protein